MGSHDHSYGAVDEGERGGADAARREPASARLATPPRDRRRMFSARYGDNDYCVAAVGGAH